MKNLTHSNKGITLIALVITIIVLLILAAVSIATLTGENGILTKATTAKENTEIAEEDEKVKLAIASAFNNQGKFDQDLFLKELGNQGLSGEKDENGNVVVKTSHKIYTIDREGRPDITLKPEEVWETLASQITAENYGDFVDYGMDLNNDHNTKNDWKIFYKDNNNNVFLIAADYLDYTLNEDKLDLTENNGIGLEKQFEENGKYALNWNNNKLPTVETQRAGIQKEIFMATEYDITSDTYSNNTTAKQAATLLNTTNWINFTNQYADKAIGSPTLQMWVASWNDKGKINNDGYTELSTSIDDEGYKVNDAISSYVLSTSGTVKSKTGYYDELYFPHRVGINDSPSSTCYGYWLASPSCSSNDLCSVDCEGKVGDICDRNDAVRPVVKLKSIKGHLDNNIWTLKS